MAAPLDGVEARLDELHARPIDDEQSARSALSELMSIVRQANEAIDRGATASTRPEFADHAVTDGVLERLRAWIDRIIDKLTAIVEKIPAATSFSISVGTGLSIMVTFGPFPAP